MKAVVAAFNQEKALVGAFSVLTNLRMELFQALVLSRSVPHWPAPGAAVGVAPVIPRQHAVTQRQAARHLPHLVRGALGRYRVDS